jgi:very-short-patch-repair endonuclease
MHEIATLIRSRGYFLRRRDLLPLGYVDADLREALARGAIFRVRQGWYSVPDAPDHAVQAVRVGGRLTSLSALRSMDIPVPKHTALHVAVPKTGSRLRNPVDRRVRLAPGSPVVVHWRDTRAGGNSWRVSASDALLQVLIDEHRDVAVACCGLALRRGAVSEAQLDRVFARAPLRVRMWRRLVSSLDEAHGETYFRLWADDAGIACEQQVHVPGAGRFDLQVVGTRVYIEIDGAQHDPSWDGDSPSSWVEGLRRDAIVAVDGGRVLHFGYRQLYAEWATVLAVLDRAISDDAALTARRRRHPYRSRVRRKRRSIAPHPPFS